jgi:hypothetical protein
MQVKFSLKQFNWDKHISALLWSFLLVVLLLEGWAIQRSVVIILRSRDIVSTFENKTTRVNFGLYDGILKRWQENAKYEPEPLVGGNPFGVVDVPPPGQ